MTQLVLCQGGGPKPPNRIPLTPCTISFLVPRNPRHADPSIPIRRPTHVTGRPQAAHVMAEAAESTNSEYSPGIRRPLGFADTAPPTLQHGLPAPRPKPSLRSQRSRPTQSQTTARPPRVDGRAGIADRRSPRRKNRGVDSCTPALSNRRGGSLAMAATCRPVLRRPIHSPLSPNSALVHPSAGASHSPSILGDSDARRSLFSRRAARPRPGTLLDPEGSHFPGEIGRAHV